MGFRHKRLAMDGQDLQFFGLAPELAGVPSPTWARRSNFEPLGTGRRPYPLLQQAQAYSPGPMVSKFGPTGHAKPTKPSQAKLGEASHAKLRHALAQ